MDQLIMNVLTQHNGLSLKSFIRYSQLILTKLDNSLVVLHLGTDANEMNVIAANIREEVNKILDLIKSKYNAEFRTLTDAQWDELMTEENIDKIKHSLETIEKILKKKQDEYIKAYLLANKL